MQEVRVTGTVGIPARTPGVVVAESEAVRVCFLSHWCLLVLAHCQLDSDVAGPLEDAMRPHPLRGRPGSFQTGSAVDGDGLDEDPIDVDPRLGVARGWPEPISPTSRRRELRTCDTAGAKSAPAPPPGRERDRRPAAPCAATSDSSAELLVRPWPSPTVRLGPTDRHRRGRGRSASARTRRACARPCSR